MPSVHIPDEFLVRIVKLGHDNWKKFIKDAVEEKLREEEEENTE